MKTSRLITLLCATFVLAFICVAGPSVCEGVGDGLPSLLSGVGDGVPSVLYGVGDNVPS